MVFPVLPQLPPRQRRVFEVTSPNLGVYPGRFEQDIPDGGLADCLNVRLKNGKITNEHVGYAAFMAASLGHQVLLIDLFKLSSGASVLIFGTKTDLFRYDTGAATARYITPIYATGTVSTTNGSPTVTGSGTTWSTNLKAGDFIAVGSATENSLAATWYEIDSVDSDTQVTLTANYAGSTASGQAYTGRKVFTGTNTDLWDADVFPLAAAGTTTSFAAGDRWIATNGTHLVAWDGSAARVQVLATSTTGLQFTCKTVSYFKNMMVYGNILESGTSKPANFKNTALGDPENVTTLEANEFTFAEGVDYLLRTEPLGDYLVGYCENSVNIAQFVGSPFYFAIRTASPDKGLYAPRTLVNFGRYHEFLSSDTAYRFDGVQMVPFADHVFAEVYEQLDHSRSAKSLAFLSNEDLEAYWILAFVTDGTGSDGGPVTAWTEHYAEAVGRAPVPFMKRQLPATATGKYVASGVGRFSDFSGIGFDELVTRFNARILGTSLPVLLFGDESGFIWQLNTETSIAGGLAFSSYIVSPTRPLADGASKGIVRRVIPYVEKSGVSGSLFVRVETQDRAAGAYTSSASQSVDIGHTDDRFASFREPGRYGRIRFSTILADQVWTLGGYRVVLETIGER